MKTAHVKNKSRPPRGIGLMTVMIATSFVAITILAFGYHFAAQMRRTRDLPHTNQHRQLLLAAADTLGARLNASQSENALAPFTLQLPPDLGEARVTCEPEAAAAPHTYKIAATSNGITTRQVVTFERKNGRFRLISAALSADISR